MEGKLKDKILEKIKEGKVKMKPKFYFVLKAILFILIFVLLLGLSFFLLSFIHFHLISSGIWYLPKFGIEGIFLFLKSLPWFLIIVAFILILILETLSREFSFKKPILISVLGLILIVLVGGFLIAKANIHPRILFKARKGEMPSPISPIYLKYGIPRFKEFHRGIIEKIAPNSLFIKRADGEVLEVKFEKPSSFPERFKEGEGILIFGKRENGKIRGWKLKKIEDQFLEFERRIIKFPPKLK